MKAEFKGQYEQLGLNIVYYRKKKKLTQLQLAELVDIDRSHISAIELGNVGASFVLHPRPYLISEISPNHPSSDKHSGANASPYQWWIFFCSRQLSDGHFHHK